MSPLRPQSSTARGFTLIEILVICALIALLSGIAVLNVKQVMDQARVKASYADIRGVADALSNARMDLAVFPKLGYLSQTQAQIVQNGNTLPDDFETMGFSTAQAIGLQRVNQIIDDWKGPYFNAAGGRSPLKAGTSGYYIKMQMPRAAAGTPLVDWPADPWGSPYVVYLIHQDRGGTPHFVRSPYEEPNFFAAVVSYGPNGIPGGSADPHFAQPSVIAEGRKYRLFTTLGPNPYAPTGFVALTDTQLPLTNDGLTTRLLSLNMTNAAPFSYLGASFPNVPGMLDGSFTASDGSRVMGSDDIVVPLR